MNKRDFQKERKWCPKCESYRHYLMMLNHSFCADCGAQMRLFSKRDQQRFNEDLQNRRMHKTGS